MPVELASRFEVHEAVIWKCIDLGVVTVDWAVVDELIAKMDASPIKSVTMQLGRLYAKNTDGHSRVFMKRAAISLVRKGNKVLAFGV